MKKFISEFKEFAVKGNMFDLAVGVMIGSAFSGLVTALVQKIIMPIVGVFIGGIDLSMWTVNIPSLYGGEPIAWEIGAFLQAAIDFVILALVVFLLVKGINKLRRKKDAEPPAPPAPSKEEVLLTEIRDILKEKSL